MSKTDIIEEIAKKMGMFLISLLMLKRSIETVKDMSIHFFL